jgi:hypothetical protein
MKSKWMLPWMIAGMLLWTASPVLASTVTFNLDYQLKNEPPVDWLTATFEDIGRNKVRLTMSASDLATTDSLRIKGWYFNIENESLLGRLKFKHVDGQAARSISQGADAFGAGGSPGHGFDLYFGFASRPRNAFGEGEESVYILKGRGLAAAMFNLSNQDGLGDFFSAAKVEGGGQGAGVLAAVPIPGAAWMLGAGLVGLVAIRRRRGAGGGLRSV